MKRIPGPGLFAFTVLVVSVASQGPTRADGPAATEPPAAAGPSVSATSAIEAAETLAGAFRHAVETARPSIVTLRTVDRRPESEDGPEAYRSGSATGVIVDRTGGVLTSFHAVSDAEAVSVVLADGREFPASEVQGDVWSDLALVRVAGVDDLPEARFGDSRGVGVGDWVIAAGDSFGLGFSANPGNVSAKERDLDESNVPLLQTTAASNPGNSGGPLLNLRGEVIGICEGGYSVQGGFDGVSFAIPAQVARFVATELIEHGSVRWPYLGAHFETLSPDVARGLGYPQSQRGAVLTEVVSGGPAEQAGLRVGDVVTRLGPAPVRDALELMSAVQRTHVGDTVAVEVAGGQGPVDREVRIGLMPNSEDAAKDEAGADVEAREETEFVVPDIGIAVTDLPPEGDPARADYPADLRGVLIRRVEPKSPARYLGVHPGTVVTHVGTRPVAGLDEFKTLFESGGPAAEMVVLVWCADCGEHFFAFRSGLARPSLKPSKGERRD